jgi:hypothetical protein
LTTTYINTFLVLLKEEGGEMRMEKEREGKGVTIIKNFHLLTAI